MIEFTAILQKHEGINGAYIEMPFDVTEVFGAKRVKVFAAFDGVPYRGLIVTMKGCTFLGVTQEIRNKIGKNPGDEISVTLKKDEEERIVKIPEDFAALLQAHADAYDFYKTLSFTNQKSYIQWLTSAKTDTTRLRRMQEAIGMLCAKAIKK